MVRYAAVAAAVVPTLASDAAAQEAVDPAVAAAVSRGVQFLVTQQRPDGSIIEQHNATAMTSLALMAMAATGTTPSDPTPAGQAMRRALDYIIQPQRRNADGYFGESDGSRMYGHGITALMLTELYGMGADATQDQGIGEACRQAVDLILAAQDVPKGSGFQGGWRYTPTSNDADLSVSVWQLLALRSAANDQLDVPPESIASAVGYLKRSFTAPLDERGAPSEPVGGFGYMPRGRKATFAMTAAGALALQICGEYDSPLVDAAEAWLRENPPNRNERFFYYGIYYYAQAMHARGGETAQLADVKTTELLLPAQRGDGSWLADNAEERNAGAVYSTALSILALTVRYHYLPIYQR